MNEVWYTCPSANPNAVDCLSRWKKQGFKLAILGEKDYGLSDMFFYNRNSDFRGCVWANNLLIDKLRVASKELIWVGSDDYYPDERYTAEQVSDIYKSVFPNLDGVMEAGDGKLDYERGLAIAPMIGLSYINSHRPTWPDGYYHFCADRELAIVAEKEGKFVNEPRLKFSHRHWSRHGSKQPEHMSRWEALYSKDKEVFKERWPAYPL